MTNSIQKNRMSRGSPKLLFIVVTSVVLAIGTWACDSPDVAERSAPVEATGEVLSYTLVGYMDGYVGQGGEIDGVQNPILEVNAGDEIEIHFINGESMPHDIAFKAHDIASDMLVRADEETTIRFVAEADDEYYCTVPGHEQAGMVGNLSVIGGADAPSTTEPRARLE